MRLKGGGYHLSARGSQRRPVATFSGLPARKICSGRPQKGSKLREQGSFWPAAGASSPTTSGASLSTGGPPPLSTVPNRPGAHAAKEQASCGDPKAKARAGGLLRIQHYTASPAPHSPVCVARDNGHHAQPLLVLAHVVQQRAEHVELALVLAQPASRAGGAAGQPGTSALSWQEATVVGNHVAQPGGSTSSPGAVHTLHWHRSPRIYTRSLQCQPLAAAWVGPKPAGARSLAGVAVDGYV